MGLSNKLKRLEREIETLVNQMSLENEVDMPDFIIARHMVQSFEGLILTVNRNNEYTDTKLLKDVESIALSPAGVAEFDETIDDTVEKAKPR